MFKQYSLFIDWFMQFNSATHKYDFVFENQVALLYHQFPQILTGGMVIASGITWLFYSDENGSLALLWLTSIYLFSAIRFYFYRVKQSGHSKISTKRWASIGINFSFISGLQWAATTLVFFNSDSLQDIVVLILVLLGMISAAVGSLSVLPAAFSAFVAPITVALIVMVLNAQQHGLHVLVYFVVVFIFVNAIFCRNTYKSHMHVIKLNIENELLIENLSIEKEKAETANIAKSKFLAAASHDLRQPLQSMTMFTDALTENLTEEGNLKLAARITKSHDALSELLNALLDISKLDAGGIAVSETAFDLSDMLTELASEFQPLISQNHQQLAVSKKPCLVYCDPVIVKRILQNLIANAIKYSEVESMIIVEAVLQDGHYVVHTKDNGPGIAKSEQSNIFNEFHQLHNPERDRNKGLGLGLAIVKRLVKLLGSEIKLVSDIGAGCDFSFSLTQAEPAQVKETYKFSISNSLRSLDGVGVLLVEDEIDVREALSLVLKRWGCEIWETDNVSGALAFVNQYKVNIIISDYRLRAHETGIDVLTKIEQAGFDIPGILVTGDIAAEQIKEFIVSGYTVLHKPVKPALLRAAIQNIIHIEKSSRKVK